ncbi:MAG: hypothetical protein NTU41_06110 [Chloroflexi bacterium]|nr:hypothetical protein [Chloroflexota bacterium]
MLVITKETVAALRERLTDPVQTVGCQEEIGTMLEIKRALLWRADAGTCCAGPELAGRLFGEVRLLEGVLQALQDGDCPKAVLMFDDFALQAEAA